MPNFSRPAAELFEYAPAKLNLYLHVLGRDHRQYHLLDSLVAFADAADVVQAVPASRFSLAIDGPYGIGLEADERNLVWRAATALGNLAGRDPAYAVTLTKNLPVASGIGGGSADAAAMLRLLCREWELDSLAPQVLALGKGLGEDIPVCLASVTSYMGGTGEMLDPAPVLPFCPIVLVNPGIAVPTREVFARRTAPFSQAGRLAAGPVTVADLAAALQSRHNDLAPPAIGMAPVIDTVLAALAGAPACLLSRMLGSGATCYGLFATPAAAAACATALKASQPGWWVHAGHLIAGPKDLTNSA